MRLKSVFGVGHTVFLLCVLTSAHLAQAWGTRGHHAICVVASYSVKEPGLRAFLKNHSEMMGHLCNIPDTYWKGLKENGKGNRGSHFIDPDQFPEMWNDVKRDSYQALFKKLNPLVKGEEFGSLWWRTDQLSRIIVDEGKRLARLHPPGEQEKFNPKNPYNRSAAQMTAALGTLGHFIGDSSMPFHNTKDYDGWNAGHGGIHFFYETQCVNELGLDLQDRIAKEIPNVEVPKIVKLDDVFNKMQEMSALSVKDVQKVYEADKISEKSKSEKRKTPAKRPPPAEAVKAFEKLIIVDLARGAKLLAETWDALYVEAGRPELVPFRTYQYPLYPFTPDYIEPNYLKK